MHMCKLRLISICIYVYMIGGIYAGLGVLISCKDQLHTTQHQQKFIWSSLGNLVIFDITVVSRSKLLRQKNTTLNEIYTPEVFIWSLKFSAPGNSEIPMGNPSFSGSMLNLGTCKMNHHISRGAVKPFPGLSNLVHLHFDHVRIQEDISSNVISIYIYMIGVEIFWHIFFGAQCQKIYI